MSNPIKVFVVDDHLVVREGITLMLKAEKDIEVVGQAVNAQDTLSQIGKLVPDIILMDLKMPGVDGIQLTRMVRNKLPSCKVVILTLFDQYVGDAITAGAKGYLLKDITREELVDSIKRVYRGEEVYDKKIRPIIKVDYEDKSDEGGQLLPGTGTKETPALVISSSFEQVKVFILPPADIGQSLRITSVLEEALSGDFRQVEGTLLDGISIIFQLNKPLFSEEINRRLSKVFQIKTINDDALTGIDDSQKFIKAKQKFDMKHPLVKTVFVQLNPAG